MIYFKDKEPFAFDYVEGETPDAEWLDTLGVYGTPLGFNELVVLPRVDINRMESKLSNYKACNTTCDYCLEEHFDKADDADAIKPYAKHAFIRESILKYKPSVIELTGGELFQINNMKALNNMFSFLDEIDPDNKIIMEFITNGKEPLITKKYFKNPRTYISISYDPDTGDNYRHIDETVVFETIKELAKIDTSRFLVFWMISSHSDLDKIGPTIEILNELGVQWTIQPINDVTGFFDGNQKYNASFVKELIDKVPKVLDDYSTSRLLFPRISCLDGCVVVHAKEKVSRCTFTDKYDVYPGFDDVFKDANKLTVSAGVSHVCSMLNTDGPSVISNYDEIERMGYSLIGYNLMQKDNASAKIKSIEVIYQYMREFKKAITTPNPNPFEGEKVAVETSYPQTQIGQQMIVRLMEKVGIEISDVIDTTNAFDDNLWFKYPDGETAEVILYEDYLKMDINPNKPVVVYTFNNFPCRLIFFGRSIDVTNSLLYNKNNIYPRMLSNAPSVLPMITEHITGEII